MLPILHLCARLIADQIGRDRQRETAKFAAPATGASVDASPGASAGAVAAAPPRSVVDPLTSLANRYGLEAGLADLLTETMRSGGRVCVIFIAIDDFVTIEETARPEALDTLLITMARRLVAVARSGDVVGRYGLGEFVVVARIPGDTDFGSEALLRARYTAATSGPTPPGAGAGAPDHVAASVGTAISRPGDTPRSLLQRADETMFEAQQMKLHRQASKAI